MGFAAFPWWRRALVSLSCAAVAALPLVPAPSRGRLPRGDSDARRLDPAVVATRRGAAWSVRSRRPANPFAAGHRGADLAAAPGHRGPRRGAGRSSFAGDVAGTLHVVVAHADGLRTSYSFLARRLGARRPDRRTRGSPRARRRHPGDEHDAGVLHFGLRVGDRYVDPMALFRPRDLTELVRLVPAVRAPARPGCRPTASGPTSSSGSPSQPRAPPTAPAGAGPAAGERAVTTTAVAVTASRSSATPCPRVRRRRLDRRHNRRRARRRSVDPARRRERRPRARPRSSKRRSTRWSRRSRRRDRVRLAHLAAADAGRHGLSDLVEIGQRFWEWTQRVCSKDSPPADGTGGDGHLLMAVGGIDSHTFADGRTFGLDTQALGYPDGGRHVVLVRARRGGSTAKADTHGDLREKAAAPRRSAGSAWPATHPGQPVDLIAHSQGGVVVDWFLTHIYKDEPGRYPPLDTVVTLLVAAPGRAVRDRWVDSCARGSDVRCVTLDRRSRPRFDYPPSDAHGGAAARRRVGLHGATCSTAVSPTRSTSRRSAAPTTRSFPRTTSSVPGGRRSSSSTSTVSNDHHKIPSDPRVAAWPCEPRSSTSHFPARR